MLVADVGRDLNADSKECPSGDTSTGAEDFLEKGGNGERVSFAAASCCKRCFTGFFFGGRDLRRYLRSFVGVRGDLGSESFNDTRSDLGECWKEPFFLAFSSTFLRDFFFFLDFFFFFVSRSVSAFAPLEALSFLRDFINGFGSDSGWRKAGVGNEACRTGYGGGQISFGFELALVPYERLAFDSASEFDFEKLEGCREACRMGYGGGRIELSTDAGGSSLPRTNGLLNLSFLVVPKSACFVRHFPGESRRTGAVGISYDDPSRDGSGP